MRFHPAGPTPLCAEGAPRREGKSVPSSCVWFGVFVHACRGRGIVQAIIQDYCSTKGGGNMMGGEAREYTSWDPEGPLVTPLPTPRSPLHRDQRAPPAGGRGSLVPGGRGLSSSHPTSPTSQGQGPALSCPIVCHRAPNPPPPPRKPLPVRGGVDGASAKEADVGP